MSVGSNLPPSKSFSTGEWLVSEIAGTFVLFILSAGIYLRHLYQPPVFFEDTTDESRLQRALHDHATLNASERVCTVDENNVPTPFGHVRSEMRLRKLWHRATYMVIRHDSSSQQQQQQDEPHFLIQKRSNIKDYCPGKLDITPGGVVGYCETFQDNAKRELMEEMNIRVSWSTSTAYHGLNENENSIRYLFAFPYQDSKVRVWGGMFEVLFHGCIDDIKIQTSEVSQVLRMSLSQVLFHMKHNSDDWMPDSIYAFQLYLQRTTDEQTKRRLLQGYSSGDLSRYSLRPKPQAIFFDCDDTLYFDNWKLANLLTSKIEEWCVNKVGLKQGQAYELYKQHGTALRGLLAEGLIDSSMESIDEFLHAVHDVPVENFLERDEALRQMLLSMDCSIPKYIFTASARHHAERCLKALGIDDLFVDIIDVRTCNLATKHSPESFRVAMTVAKVEEPEACIFFDDSVKNISAAREIGWRSVLVGRIGRDSGLRISSDDAEHEIERIHEARHVLPELFKSSGSFL